MQCAAKHLKCRLCPAVRENRVRAQRDDDEIRKTETNCCVFSKRQACRLNYGPPRRVHHPRGCRAA